MKKSLVIAAVAASLALGGCATSQTAENYTVGQVMAPMKVSMGTVISVRDVKISHQASGAGGLAGAGLGALAGGQLGNGRGSLAGMLIGAVVGGVAGVVADKAANSATGIEIIYKDTTTGETLALVQEKDDKNVIQVGDTIRILANGMSSRAERV